jgi:diketogulonate reductase-like aldo/keto reductase
MAKAPTVKLASGHDMPILGLGTWKAPKDQTIISVKEAIKAGYRMIDTANDYDNEDAVGAAIAECIAEGIVKREELFIQSKLWNTNHRKEHVKADLLATLEDLKLTYVDSFVIHWPQAVPSTGKNASVRKNGAGPGPAAENPMFPLDNEGYYCTDKGSHYVETWHAMEDLVDEGLVKSIGVSNFNLTQLREVLGCVKKHPVSVLQNECHPYLQNKDLLDYCKSANVQLQGYSPLGSRDRPWAKEGSITSGAPRSGCELLEDPVIKTMCAKYNKSPAQIVLRWHIQRGVSVVPKSVNPVRLRENIDIFDFTLSPEDMTQFDVLNIGWRHLIWAEASNHPDYPFKDDLSGSYVLGKAPTNTSKPGQ